MPAGILGRYYSARHEYGHYRSAAITGCYHLERPADLTNILKYALAKIIERHPALCHGVTEKSTKSEAHFVRLEQIRWDDIAKCICFDASKSAPWDIEDLALARILGKEHRQLWQGGGMPAWRIAVLTHNTPPSEQGTDVEIAFFFHHAIVDGISGCAFHEMLLQAFNDPLSRINADHLWPVNISPTIARPIPLEDVLGFVPTHGTLTIEPPPATSIEVFEAWSAVPPSLPSIEEYETRVIITTIPSFQVKNILLMCRRLNITFTGLLHSLIIVYLAKNIPEARGFSAVTPYSMRRFTHLSVNEMANQISTITTKWSTTLLDAARSSKANSEEEEAVIKLISKQFQDEMTDEFDRVPKEGPQILKAVSKITDFGKFCEHSMKGRREHTYELSNIGVHEFDVLELDEGHQASFDGGVALRKLVFTQCGMVAGPAIGCSVVTVKHGPLTLSLHWQQGIVEEKLMKALGRSLMERLLQFT